MVAQAAVGSLAATHHRAWLFVDELWNLSVPRGRWRYYDGLLSMLSLLHVSGRFRIWAPQEQAEMRRSWLSDTALASGRSIDCPLPPQITCATRIRTIRRRDPETAVHFNMRRLIILHDSVLNYRIPRLDEKVE